MRKSLESLSSQGPSLFERTVPLTTMVSFFLQQARVAHVRVFAVRRSVPQPVLARGARAHARAWRAATRVRVRRSLRVPEGSGGA